MTRRAPKPKTGPKILPIGHDQPLPELAPVTITDEDMAAASATWDRVMPKRYRNLLNAEVVKDG